MRVNGIWLSLLAIFSLAASSFAWTAEDHEIFDLVSALEAAEGPKVNFYSFLNVTPQATTSEIGKSYRKRSLELHPDRGGTQERFARLGTIAGILRNEDKRKRYHHFYENGVPKWRGTGYYYSRYRPGLGAVAVFLSLLSVLVQYAVQHLARFSEVQRIKRFQDRAKEVAWGSPNNPPRDTSIKKRVKVPLGPSNNPDNMVSMTVEGNGRVCIISEDGTLQPLDASAARQPSFKSTWLPSLIQSAIDKIQAKPASINSVPSAVGLGNVDATATPPDAQLETEADSRPETPTEEGSMNRKQRRAEQKTRKRK